ncbi:MAG TPA: Ku protein [Clostridia bacterium]|nr:Ku protein [Clostridia bacterium]
MHTIWKGNIAFGLVNIPVKLHGAAEDKDVKLRSLHKECNTPINYEKVCPQCGRKLTNEEIVKAYEYAPNKFVILDENDLKQLKQEREAKAVTIVDFVRLEEIDPVYFDRSYYLSPGEGGAKAYALLRQALSETGKIGVARIAIREKEHLAVIRIFHNVLVLETIYYPDEVRDINEIPNIPVDISLTSREIDTAKLLIDQLTGVFEPGKYIDQHRSSLLELINAKIEKKAVTTPAEVPAAANVIDLMEALKASIEQTAPKREVRPKKIRKKA